MSSRERPETDDMASSAFMMRFRITCCSWMRSPNIAGSACASSVRAVTWWRSISRSTTRSIIDDLVEIEADLLRFRPFGESAQPSHDFAGAVAVADHGLHGLTRLPQVGRLLAEPP